MLGRLRLRAALLLCLLVPLLAACGGDSDDTPTSTPAAPTATVTPALPSEVAGVTGSIASDGVCQVTVPDEWTDEGAAAGRTLAGARWTLFGGRLRTAEDWTAAAGLLKGQQGNRPGATVEESDDRIVVTLADNRGLVVRQRFPDRYCELSVTSTTSVSPEEVALWSGVAETLEPAGA
jgi:hypothetical protein